MMPFVFTSIINTLMNSSSLKVSSKVRKSP